MLTDAVVSIGLPLHTHTPLSLCLSATLPFPLSFKRCCDTAMRIIRNTDFSLSSSYHFKGYTYIKIQPYYHPKSNIKKLPVKLWLQQRNNLMYYDLVHNYINSEHSWNFIHLWWTKPTICVHRYLISDVLISCGLQNIEIIVFTTNKSISMIQNHHHFLLRKNNIFVLSFDIWFILGHPRNATIKIFTAVIYTVPGVNFTNILWAAFAPNSFRQKITNPL